MLFSFAKKSIEHPRKKNNMTFDPSGAHPTLKESPGRIMGHKVVLGA